MTDRIPIPLSPEDLQEIERALPEDTPVRARIRSMLDLDPLRRPQPFAPEDAACTDPFWSPASHETTARLPPDDETTPR